MNKKYIVVALVGPGSPDALHFAIHHALRDRASVVDIKTVSHELKLDKHSINPSLLLDMKNWDAPIIPLEQPKSKFISKPLNNFKKR